jgi:hypothetical protein
VLIVVHLTVVLVAAQKSSFPLFRCYSGLKLHRLPLHRQRSRFKAEVFAGTGCLRRARGGRRGLGGPKQAARYLKVTCSSRYRCPEYRPDNSSNT